jgi:sugar lactone lactonase YvrE
MAQHLRTKPLQRNQCNPWRNRVLGCVVAVVIAACGGGEPTTGSLPTAMQPIIATGADGASMDFTPAEGWVPVTPLTITRDGAGAPDLPPGMEAVGSVYRFTPQDHVGGAIEIRVPFDAAQSSAGTPRLLVALPKEDSWSEVDAQLEGTTLRARVPALGYAVATRPLSAAGAERMAASASQPAQYLRGQLNAQPALQGNAFLLTATSPSLATAQFDYSVAKSCANPVQLRLRALVVLRPTSTQGLAVRTVNLGTRPLAARAGSERIEFPLAAADNGTWVFLADMRCIEQERVRFSVLSVLPALVVTIADNSASPEVSATLGSAGGVVAGPDGVQLIVPRGTVNTATTFRVARDGAGAPELIGLNAVSPIYAITPHGEAFDGAARVSIPLTAAQRLPVGEQPLLLKAAPGGKWRIMQNVSQDPTRLAVDVDELSYFVVGSCTSTNPEWVIGAVNCPGLDHRLELILAGPAGQGRILVGTGVNTPAWSVANTPQTLPMNATWTRPQGTGRTDLLGVVGSPGGFNTTGFRSTWTSEVVSVGPEFGSFSKPFDVRIDPAQVPLANVGRGRTLRIRSIASYETTALRIGSGPVTVGFEFQVDFPVLVSYAGVLPIISQQPADLRVTEGQPASFTVAASVTPAAALTYQWSRRATPASAFAPIVGATAASYQLATTSLADDGAQFQVLVCAGINGCVTSNAATLSVTALQVQPVAPVFTLQPANTGVTAGQNASFSVTATGSPLPRIEWQSAAAADPNNFTPVVGMAGCPRTDPPAAGPSTSAACIVGPLTLADNGRRYRAVATNSATSVNSLAATLTVNAAPVAPAITVQPTPQTTTVGGSAVFNVTANGTGRLEYTWTVNGSNLPSIDSSFNTGTCSGRVTYSNSNATITLTELSAGCDGALVGVTVSNGVNPSAVSNIVVLTVNAVTQALSLLAGDIGGPGSLDGTGAEARVTLGPQNGIAVDGAGNAYFSEASSGKVRRVTPAGVVTTIAGASNPLNGPAGVVIDRAGNLFVAESGVGRIVRITPAGVLSTWAAESSLSVATHLAIDAGDNLYVTSEPSGPGGAGLISKISPAQVVTPFYTFGSGEFIGAIAVASDGSLYGARNSSVVRISPAGVLSILAGTPSETGNVDGIGAAARFNGIAGLTLSAAGDLYATDAGNGSVRRITQAGVVTTVSGGGGPTEPVDGAGTAARYALPGGIATLPGGDMLIGDGATLRRLAPLPNYFASTFVGKRVRSGINVGDLALDAAGNAYLAGRVGSNLRVTPAGAASTLTGTATGDFSYHIAFDATRGELVQASSFAVWRMTTAGAATLWAGNPDEQGYVDGTGAAARFDQIKGLTVDAAGNVFVAEGQSFTIRRITPAGVVSTYAGAQGQAGSADGAAANARFNGPGAMAADAGGDLFVSDGFVTIRRITPAGQVTTVAGSPNVVGSVDGIGTAVRFRSLSKLAFEPSGNLLIGDSSTLRRMTPAYAVTTVMGVDGESSVRLGNLPRLNFIRGLAVRPNGRAVLTSEAAVLEAVLP